MACNQLWLGSYFKLCWNLLKIEEFESVVTHHTCGISLIPQVVGTYVYC